MVTSTQRPQAPEPIAVEIPYGHGVSEGVSWPWPSSDLAVLVLHDLDADLDTVPGCASVPPPRGPTSSPLTSPATA